LATEQPSDLGLPFYTVIIIITTTTQATTMEREHIQIEEHSKESSRSLIVGRQNNKV
jgi:hypothetical protein